MASSVSKKILVRMKGLQAQVREGEEPLLSIPVIWENASEQHSQACDLVLTNQRLFGYIYTTFPRERLFLDALELAEIQSISIQRKSFETVFRELLVSDGKKRIFIRATRKKIEEVSALLRSTLEDQFALAPTQHTAKEETDQEYTQTDARPVYASQQVKRTFERSPFGVMLLFVGGLSLEIVGALAWAATGSAQTGMPLFIAGLVAVVMAVLVRRQL